MVVDMLPVQQVTMVAASRTESICIDPMLTYCVPRLQKKHDRLGEEVNAIAWYAGLRLTEPASW